MRVAGGSGDRVGPARGMVGFGIAPIHRAEFSIEFARKSWRCSVNATNYPSLTAGDLMSRDIKTLRADLSLREAAVQLTEWGVHGAPVVDAQGQCVGLLSVTDLARAAAKGGDTHSTSPRSCAFQETAREPGGRETIRCRLPAGVCLFQRLHTTPAGSQSVICGEPQGIPTDWQMMEVEAHPHATVQDYMTTTLVTVSPESCVTELARTMLEHGVHRLIVLDPEKRPVGFVSVNDWLQYLAHPELTTVGAAQ